MHLRLKKTLITMMKLPSGNDTCSPLLKDNKMTKESRYLLGVTISLQKDMK